MSLNDLSHFNSKLIKWRDNQQNSVVKLTPFFQDDPEKMLWKEPLYFGWWPRMHHTLQRVCVTDCTLTLLSSSPYDFIRKTQSRLWLPLHTKHWQGSSFTKNTASHQCQLHQRTPRQIRLTPHNIPSTTFTQHHTNCNLI